jgi:ADP-ribosylglycohydrolase
VNDAEPRFSLVAGEGDGAMLGMAAGDTAGGSWELGYSAVTEQTTVVAYHLIEHGRIQPQSLVTAIRELDGSSEEEPVYRAESAQFRAWLEATQDGGVAESAPSLDGAPRAVPLGVVFRREPDVLREQGLVLGKLFHSDPASILAGMVSAGAVAASCFGQSGRDLIAGVVEMVEPASSLIGDSADDDPQVGELVEELRVLRSHVGVEEGPEALSLASGDATPGAWDKLKAGLLLAAPIVERPHVPIEQAAKIGGSALAATVGGVVGARVGIRAWPWAFANDTWFAEIGRRLARGPRDVSDLPIPYAVEHHLISGERQGIF